MLNKESVDDFVPFNEAPPLLMPGLFWLIKRIPAIILQFMALL